MDSMPPATTTSMLPAASRSCASIAAFMPEPHILFTVVQPAASGSPAPRLAWRAGAWPWPAGSTQPMITSPTASGASFARSTAARIAAAPSSGAAKPFSSPWKPPIGVRAAETMTIGSDGMRVSFLACREYGVSQRFSCARRERLRQRARLARLRVDVHADEATRRAQLAGDAVAHLVQELDRLRAHLEQPRVDAHHVAGEELLLVLQVLLHCNHGRALRAQRGAVEPDVREQVPGGLVELAHVPHDVHVSHVVAVPRVDRAAVGFE